MKSPDVIDKIVRVSFKYVKNFRPQHETASEIGDEFEDKIDFLLPRGVQIISRRDEYRFGMDIPSSSGLRHEIDKIVWYGNALVVMEFKHLIVDSVIKNPFLIFFGKLLDYYLTMLRLGFKEKLYAIFLTCDKKIPDNVRLFCFTWGIQLVDPSIRPPAVLEYVSEQLSKYKRQGLLFGFSNEYINSLNRRCRRLNNIVRKGISEILYRDPSTVRYLLFDVANILEFGMSRSLLDEQKAINQEADDLLSQLRKETRT